MFNIREKETAMKRTVLTLLMLCLILLSTPSLSHAVFRVEVLQAGKLDIYEETYQGIIAGFEKNGFTPGKDLVITRTVIDDTDGEEVYTWNNLKYLMQIKTSSAEIIARKPDLAITIGTYATRYARSRFVKAGIPLVFTCVSMPEMAGCPSKTEGGPGVTGVSIYTDPADIIRIAKEGMPGINKIGIILSDEITALACTEDVRSKASAQGIEVVAKQLNLWERITPAAEEMISQGVDAFYIPVDRYYRVKDYNRAKELIRLCFDRKLPCLSSAIPAVKGSLIQASPDFHAVGILTADQATMILNNGVKPETISIAHTPGRSISIDSEASRKLGIEIHVRAPGRAGRRTSS